MRTKLTKVLGVSLLAIVGILAINASAANATWTMLRNGAAANPNLLNLNATLLGTEFLVPGFFKINCTGGSATIHLLGGTTLQANTHAAFTGCTILNFPLCEVHSPGRPVGTLLFSASGTGSLSGTSVLLLMLGSPLLSEVIVENELCPYAETEAPLTGKITLLILNAATNAAEHLAHLNDDGMKFADFDAFIDSGGGIDDTALWHVTEASGATWAIDHS